MHFQDILQPMENTYMLFAKYFYFISSNIHEKHPADSSVNHCSQNVDSLGLKKYLIQF